MIQTNSRGHDQCIRSGVAKTLQHSEETALKFYQVPGTDEALRIDTADQTARFEEEVMKEFDDIFAPEPYINLNNGAQVREKLIESTAYTMHPTAVISDGFIKKIQRQFNRSVLDSRVDIIYEYAVQYHTADNIDKRTLTDLTREKKIHFVTQDIDVVGTIEIKTETPRTS
ncbi:unnamed protein product [Macrosiphum euphorbiae]|uniref:Uncharacterized protein n=1 Tax=Macrosiphum euphorbiae TaxID=13131 RepID=A0AAV0Y518_9HEMI|nr:unnamed protein product [Macrosiphum euphorbiae]